MGFNLAVIVCFVLLLCPQCLFASIRHRY